MLVRSWLLAVALGLTLAPSWCGAQEAPEAAVEGQPVTEPGQQESGPTGETNAPSEDAEPPDLAPSLQGIEAAIRDLIAEEDEIERQRQEEREIRDLNAQEEMAGWAREMFWTSAATVVLTAVGVILIWRTLKATRDAVKEAEKATVAAQEAVNVTHEIGGRQLRAYLGFIGIESQLAPNEAFVRVAVNFKNTGQTPARRVRIRMGSFIKTAKNQPFVINCSDKEAMPSGPTDLGAGEAVSCSLNITRENFDVAAGTTASGEGMFLIVMSVRYEDVFKNPRRTLVTRMLEPRALSEYGMVLFVAYPKGNRST